MARMDAPPSLHVEWLWQSPRRASLTTAPSGVMGISVSASSFTRYDGTSPANASVMARADAAPIPGRAVGVSFLARAAHSSGSVSLTRARAPVHAFVLKPPTKARSRQWTIRARASSGVTLFRLGGTRPASGGRDAQLEGHAHLVDEIGDGLGSAAVDGASGGAVRVAFPRPGPPAHAGDQRHPVDAHRAGGRRPADPSTGVDARRLRVVAGQHHGRRTGHAAASLVTPSP